MQQERRRVISLAADKLFRMSNAIEMHEKRIETYHNQLKKDNMKRMMKSASKFELQNENF